MFVQVIRGKAADVEGLRRQLERWGEELRPGAVGYLGTTAGATGDGTFVVLARFESQEAARANSDRPEQGAWWSETEKCFTGEVTFRNCTDVEVTIEPRRADDAGFVQIIEARAKDPARLRRFEQEFLTKLVDVRPDLLGNYRAWDGDTFVQVAYFTNEAEAREGERKMAEGELAPVIAEWSSLMDGATFYDLRDPLIR